MAENGRDGMQWSDFMGSDWLHPNDRGHKIMADMVVQLLQQTAIDLAVHPVSAADNATTTTPLPPPMFDGGSGLRVQGSYGTVSVTLICIVAMMVALLQAHWLPNQKGMVVHQLYEPECLSWTSVTHI